MPHSKNKIKDLITEYVRLDSSILNLIWAEFFLQLINSSFLAILPLYMKKEGYTDGMIADATKYRYLGVLVLALIVGYLIKNRKLKPFFLLSTILVPSFAIGILYTVQTHANITNHAMQFMWGASFTLMQIPVLPYILRNSPAENHTAGISLSYATWSLGTIASSIIISALSQIDAVVFDERTILYVITFSSFIGIYLISKIEMDEKLSEQQIIENKNEKHTNADWILITKALIPTLIIAIGAGFTIPFISLFFNTVHNLDASQFASINLIASILVAIGSLMVPNIKKTMGYTRAIPLTQSLAIVALIFMCTTEYYKEMQVAVYVAIVCYLLRQPLMNLAGPMTSEVVMKYVGKRNREKVSAITSAIWSGSWFFSGLIFGVLRNEGVSYSNVFLITAAMYIVGVAWYYILILDYNKRVREGLVD
jgi:predicted MFS family arabinose efflux permease